MAKRRRKKGLRIRFKRKFPFIQLGSSPVEHVRKIRRLVGPFVNSADATVRFAEKGDCKYAMELYGQTQWYMGAIGAHQSSTSKTRYSGQTPHFRRVDFASLQRKVVKARKAVEACLVKR